MLSRSRALLLIIPALAVIAFTGCSSTKPKPERRLAMSGSSSQGDLLSQGAEGDAFGGNSFAPEEWNPSGAPDASGMDASGMMTNADAAFGADSLDSETGDLKNTASTAGVEDGSFMSELEMIHFEFDRSEISPEWKDVLDGHASWVQNHPSVMVQIEGHCDERGTEEYNTALGQRRADSVRTYLVGQGVDPDRLSTISYGEMRPLSFDATEEAHALNRRAMFLVYEIDTNQVAGEY